MRFEDVMAAVRNCAAFERLSAAQLGHLLMLASVKEVPQGEYLFKKGDKQTDEFGLIVAGGLDILSDSNGDSLFTRGGGDLMGEIGKVNPKGERTRTVRASQVTGMLFWRFSEIADADSTIADELARKFEDIAFERLAQDFD